MDAASGDSGDMSSFEFEKLPDEVQLSIFKTLTSEEQLFAREVSKTWNRLIPVTSLKMNVCDKQTLVTIRLVRGTGVTKLIIADNDINGPDPNRLDTMPQDWWPLVKSLHLIGCITKVDDDVLLIIEKCKSIESMNIEEPSDQLCAMLEVLFTNNHSTLTDLKYWDSWCGIETKTDFDFGWLANCSKLDQLWLFVRNNRFKRLELIPRDIKLFVTPTVIPMEKAVWIAANLKEMESLIIGVNEVLDLDSSAVADSTEEQSDENNDTFQLFLELGSLPKLRRMQMLIYSKGLSRGELLQEQLQPLQQLCEMAPGIESILMDLSTLPGMGMIGLVNKISHVFVCEIDRDVFTGFD